MIVQSGMDSSGATVITVAAECLDLTNAPEFREISLAAIGGSSGRLAVDCSALEFIDSSGLGAILHAHNLLPAERRPVRLFGVGPKVMSILELMQVHRLFDLEARKS